MPRIMQFSLTSLFLFALTTLLASPARANEFAADQDIQSLRLNVFLGQWQVLGPLPIEAAGLDHEYFANEQEFRGGNARFYRNRLYTWKSFDRRIVDLREALVPGSGGDRCVGYGWTQFVSDKDQTLRMAIAHDDMCAAWLNGALVCRSQLEQPSVLDQVVYDVDLKKGVNTLLVKVTNQTREWDFAVRFLPTNVQTPLIEFKSMLDLAKRDFPVVDIEILSESGQTMARHQCSGTRIAWYTFGSYYRLYANAPPKEPHAVRLVAKHPGFADFSQTYPWDVVLSRSVDLKFRSDRPLKLVAIDANSKKPVPNVVAWDQGTPYDAIVDSRGTLSVPDFQPSVLDCWVSAPGYLATKVQLDWPRRMTHTVSMHPGGCTLTGQIVSDTGAPIPNALVKTKPASYPSFQPETRTNENGRFQLHGFSASQPNFTATVSARGYMTIDNVPFTISANETTDVTWSLDTGVLVTGRVTHAKTGKPVPGVDIVTGESRFASNKITATTDQHGHYELVTSQPGLLTTTALSDRFAPSMKMTSIKRFEKNEVNLKVDDGAAIHGIVKDLNGQPIPNAQVLVDKWNDARVFSRSITTNPNGEFILPHMPQGKMVAYAQLDGYVTNQSAELSTGKLAEITLRPRVIYTYRITSKGKTIPNLSITKGYKSTGQSRYSWQSSSSSTMRNYDISSGEFTVSVNESTNYSTAFRFAGNGFEEMIVEIPPDANESKTIDIAMLPAKMFRCNVVDAATGKPKPGIAVTLVSQTARLNTDQYSNTETVFQHLTGDRFGGTYAITDANGAALLSSPPADTKVEFVLASQDGGFHHIGNLPDDLFANSDSSVTLPFPDPAIMRGMCKVGGDPVPDQVIRISWSGADGGNRFFQTGTRVSTDSQGSFKTPALAPGNYRVSRVMYFERADSVRSSFYVGSDSVILMPGETKDYMIDVPTGLTVSGIASDPNGNPLSSVFVYASGNHGNEAASMSDSEGRFKLEYLSPGSKQLYARHYSDNDGRYRVQHLASQTIDLRDSIDQLELGLRVAEERTAPVRQTIPPQSIAGTVAPKFTVASADPIKVYDSDKLLGKVVAVCAWYSHAQDLSEIQKAYEQYRDNPEVVFLTLCLGSDSGSIRALLKQHEVEFPVAFYDHRNPQTHLPLLFGISSRPGCVVIDRTGCVSGEIVSSNELGDAIRTALNDTRRLTESSRLRVKVATGAKAMLLSNATLLMQAYDHSGKLISQNQCTTPVIQNVTWNYPSIEKAGKLVVEIKGLGIPSQSKTIENPASTESLTFDVQPPREIIGRITDQDSQPVAGMKVLIFGTHSGSHEAVTGNNGAYSARCFPGEYHLTPMSDTKFAATFDYGNATYVAADKDPPPTNFTVVPAITIHGKVIDSTGKPVSSGVVSAGPSSQTFIGDDGTYTLPGVAATGTSRVVARINHQFGIIQVTDPTPDESYDVQIGKGVAHLAEPIIENDAAPLDLQTLAGESMQWNAEGSGKQCLLFCALWHPRASMLIEAAAIESQKNGAQLQIISIDFSREQAAREANRLKLPNVLYAGPQGLSLPDEWKFSTDHHCVIVSDRKIISSVQLVK